MKNKLAETNKLIDFVNFFNNTQITGGDYPGSHKNRFKKGGKFALKRIANQLGLQDKIDYDLRFNEGGPGVSGEVTLHADKIYIQIADSCMGKKAAILIRTCKGRKDYSGGYNNFLDIRSFLDGGLFNLAKNLSNQSALDKTP